MSYMLIALKHFEPFSFFLVLRQLILTVLISNLSAPSKNQPGGTQVSKAKTSY